MAAKWTYNVPSETSLISVGLQVPERKLEPNSKCSAGDGYAVFQWPEFLALAFRLGIDTNRRITRLVLDLREGYVPVVLLEQHGADAVASKIEADEEAARRADDPIKIGK